MADTPIATLPEIAQNQSNKYLTHNTALRYLEAMCFTVLSRVTTAQPGSPADGDAYIIPDGATGTDWAAYTEGNIALRFGSAWVELPAFEGLSPWVSDESARVTYNGVEWAVDIVTGEQSSDPADPPEGQYVIWMSDGTDSGDAGDIMIKISAGSTVKTATLIDFSAV